MASRFLQMYAAPSAPSRSSGGGGFFGIHLPKIGLGNALRDIIDIPVGLAKVTGNTAFALENHIPGMPHVQTQPIGRPLSQLGWGAAGGLTQLGVDAAGLIGVPGHTLGDAIVHYANSAAANHHLLGTINKHVPLHTLAQGAYHGEGLVPTLGKDIATFAGGEAALGGGAGLAARGLEAAGMEGAAESAANLSEGAEAAAHPYRSTLNAVKPVAAASTEALTGTPAAEDAATQPTDLSRKIAEKLPQPVQQALSKLDRFTQARDIRAAIRAAQRAQGVDRNLEMSSAAADAGRAAADEMLKRTLPDGTLVTPDVANKLVGDEIMARGSHVSTVEDAATKGASPEAAQAVRNALVEAGDRSAQSVPADWLHNPDGTPTPLEEKLQAATEAQRAAEGQKLDILRSSRQGEKGLEGVGSSEPTMSRRQAALAKSIIDDQQQMAKLREANIPRERARVGAQIDTLQRKIEAARATEANAQAIAYDAAQQFDASRMPTGRPVTGVPGAPTPSGLSPGDMAALGISDVTTPEGEMARTAQTPGQRLQSTPDVAVKTEHEMYRRGVEGGRSAERIRNATQDAADATRRRAALENSVSDLQRKLDEGATDSEKLHAKLDTRSTRRAAKLDAQLDEPSLKQTPAAWKPAYHALRTISEAAKSDPLIANAAGEMGTQFSKVLQLAAEKGFDATHFRSFSESEVRQLVNDATSLAPANRLGHTVTAGTRLERVGAAIRTRSFNALRASIIEATREVHANEVANTVETTAARDIPVVNGQAVVPPGWKPWDAETVGLRQGAETPEGTVAPKNATKMVPEEVTKTIAKYQRNYSHPIFKTLQGGMNGYRAFVTFLSPAYYARRMIGDAIFAVAGGARLGDFMDAWRQFRSEGFDQRVMEGSIAADYTRGGTIPYPEGPEGIKLALQGQATRVAGIKEAASIIRQRLQRPLEVTDGLARTATYLHALDEGMSAEEALGHVYKSFVDYNDLTPFERHVVRAVFPFYAWQKGVMKLVASAAIDHPAAIGLVMALGPLNQEMNQDQYGGKLPDYYSGVMPLPGVGNVNINTLSPFRDAQSYFTPDGIAASLNPLVSSVANNVTGGGSGDLQRVDQYGNVVNDTSPAQDVTNTITNLPLLGLTRAATGAGLGSSYGNVGFRQELMKRLGLPSYNDAGVQNLATRIAKSQKRLK